MTQNYFETTLYFVRHGQTIWNTEKRMQGRKNSPLTEEGVRQAESLGNAIKDSINIDYIISSPSKRALQTSRYINNYLHKNIEVENDLQEIDMGLWEGKTYSEISEKDPLDWDLYWNNPLEYRASNKGETYSQLIKRSSSALKNIINNRSDSNILIVSHRITLRAMIATLQNKKITDVPDLSSTSISKCTISSQGSVTFEYINDTSHYQEK